MRFLKKKREGLPGPNSEPECDFYLNPTLLSRLILHQKYASAIRRVKKYPLEASTWVASTRKRTTSAAAKSHSGNNNNNNCSFENTTVISGLTDHSPCEFSELGAGAPATVCTPDAPLEVRKWQRRGKTPRTTKPATPSSKKIGDEAKKHEPQDEDENPNAISSSNSTTEPLDYSFRQLPLHMACSSLSRVYDKALRKKLNELIGQLVVTFPAAARYRDHQGRLPLHEAVWNNANPDTVTMMLISYPEGVDELDIYGRTVAELNEHRKGPYKQEMRRMLLRPRSFWGLAKEEKDLRLKHAVVPEAGASIESTSVLMDSRAGEEENTLLTRESAFQGRAPIGYTPPAPLHQDEKIEATSWSQLEKRAMTLERSLAEQYEQQYNMAEELSRLREIERKYNQITSSEFLAKHVIQLEEEKAALEMQVLLMEKIMKRNDLSLDDASVFTKPTSVVLDTSRDIPSDQEENIAQIQEENEMLTAQVCLLQVRMADYKTMLEQYEAAQHRCSDATAPPAFDESVASTTDEYSESSSFDQQVQEDQETLDSLFELAQKMYGHNFSEELVEAWQSASLPSLNELPSLDEGEGTSAGLSTCGSGEEEASTAILEEILEVDEEVSVETPQTTNCQASVTSSEKAVGGTFYERRLSF